MKVLVIGAAIIDIIMEIDTLPKKGDDIPCNNTSSNVGGCAYNVASMLKNFNVEHDLLVPVGKGLYSDIIRADLEKNNYKILSENNNQDNGYCLCLVEGDGERTFITVNGAESNFKSEWFDNLNMNDYDMIYVAGYQVLSESGKIISNFLKRHKDKTIFFAPGPAINLIEEKTLENIFSCEPIIHLNDKEIVEFFKDNDIESCLNALHKKSNNTIITTLGEKGTIYFDGKKVETIATKKVTVVDTIGAGDSHISTIIACLSKSHSLKEAITLANTIASSVVSIKGPIMNKEIFNTITKS